MKQQRRFIVVLAAAWLVVATVEGNAAGIHNPMNDKTPTDTASSTSTDTASSTSTQTEAPLAKSAAPAYIGTSLTTTTYSGTRYRNGGYFGEEKSDGGF